MSAEKDFDDSSDNLFEDYVSKELFDEEDEEIGFDPHVMGDGFDASGYSHKKPQSNPIHHSVKPKKQIKPLPQSFREKGIIKAILLMKNGEVVFLK